MSIEITVSGGSVKRLLTGGKYCADDILVTATGAELPELGDPGTAEDLTEGKELLDGSGSKIVGTFTLAEELEEQDALLEQISEALDGKVGGGGSQAPGADGIPAGYQRCDFIQFKGSQLVDTGIVGNQDTQIAASFTWESSTQRHLFGCTSSDNTTSITSYMNGSWRFGDKYATKNISSKNPMLPYGVLMNASTIGVTASVSAISGVSEFETVGTLLLGGARSSDGTLPGVGITGKVFYFRVWQGEEQVLNLVPVTDGTVYRFWDLVGEKFHDSVTDTPLEGGNW